MANNKIFIPTYISSVDYQPARVLPRVFFYNGLKTCEDYFIEHRNLVSNIVTSSLESSFPYFDNYEGLEPSTGSRSLLFFNETSVYGQTPSASLYNEYWEKYVTLLYNPRTRLINCSAIIPLADYFGMELNDIVHWRGNHYHLRSISSYNLSNGSCELELLGPVLSDVISNQISPELSCAFDFTITPYVEPIGDCCPPSMSNAFTSSNDFIVEVQYDTGSGCQPCSGSGNTIYVEISGDNSTYIVFGSGSCSSTQITGSIPTSSVYLKSYTECDNETTSSYSNILYWVTGSGGGPIPIEDWLYISDVVVTCSDLCTSNYLINTPTTSSPSASFYDITSGDTINGLGGSSGFVAYSNVSTDTNTGPFRIAEVDGSGVIQSILVCGGGNNCIPL